MGQKQVPGATSCAPRSQPVDQELRPAQQ
ncbi:hypothetical protein A2U01_0046389, partial [Trifolium medium]|nr:hypothetical protein [Trifolium medium]